MLYIYLNYHADLYRFPLYSNLLKIIKSNYAYKTINNKVVQKSVIAKMHMKVHIHDLNIKFKGCKEEYRISLMIHHLFQSPTLRGFARYCIGPFACRALLFSRDASAS